MDTNLPDVDPNATTREQFAQHTEDPTCAGCHVLMEPIGFGFEHYNAVGLWRDKEHALPIDDSGEIVSTDEDNGVFHGVIELGDILAQSEQVRSCLVTQWFRFAHGRGDTEKDDCKEILEDAFRESGGDVRELLVALTQTDAFRYRTKGEGEAQ